MRFAIYSRKSVLSDRGESVENQVELCRRYLLAQYPDVGEEEIAVYEDEGFSGKDLQRPQFRRMLEDIRRLHDENLRLHSKLKTLMREMRCIEKKGEEDEDL